MGATTAGKESRKQNVNQQPPTGFNSYKDAKSLRCSHYRTVVDQPELGMVRLSSLHELDAQLVDLTENTKKKEVPHLKTCPDTLSC